MDDPIRQLPRRTIHRMEEFGLNYIGTRDDSKRPYFVNEDWFRRGKFQSDGEEWVLERRLFPPIDYFSFRPNWSSYKHDTKEVPADSKAIFLHHIIPPRLMQELALYFVEEGISPPLGPYEQLGIYVETVIPTTVINLTESDNFHDTSSNISIRTSREHYQTIMRVKKIEEGKYSEAQRELEIWRSNSDYPGTIYTLRVDKANALALFNRLILETTQLVMPASTVSATFIYMHEDAKSDKPPETLQLAIRPMIMKRIV